MQNFQKTQTTKSLTTNICFTALQLPSVLNNKNLCSTNNNFEQKEVLLNKIHKYIGAQNFEL